MKPLFFLMLQAIGNDPHGIRVRSMFICRNTQFVMSQNSSVRLVITLTLDDRKIMIRL